MPIISSPGSGSSNANNAGSVESQNGWPRFRLNKDSKRFAKRYRTEVAASTASLASTLTAYPLDSVKTRMQAYKYNNFTDCVRHTYATEGVHGFWRGAIAPLMSITLVRTISFSIYQRAKYTYDAWIYNATGVSPLAHANKPGARPSLATVTCFGAAGMTSGVILTAISCPFELTKLSAQISVLMNRGAQRQNSFEAPVSDNTSSSSKNAKSQGTWTTARTIMRHRGVSGLYSGFHLHLLRDTLGTGIYFMTYESGKQLLANARGNSPTSPGAVAVAGGLCGLVSWALIYPIDSAKSIYQRNILTHFLRVENAIASGDTATATAPPPRPSSRIRFTRRMYRGIAVSMARSCLVNAVFFSMFELIKKVVNGLEITDP